MSILMDRRHFLLSAAAAATAHALPQTGRQTAPVSGENTAAAPRSEWTIAPGTTLRAPLLGSAWYPEQWPQERWDRDLEIMQRGGFHVARVGEFAWSTLEPSEGDYHLDWLARAIREAAARGIAIVLGTPTDAPPAWLTQKYPQTLRVDADGRRAQHGNRRQFSYSNPLYRQFCRKIATALARRFGHDPAVIGWQIGNEYSDESFDPATKAAFQQFLRAKYKTLDALNRHWTTAYWSQTYDRWDEIPMEVSSGNPGLLLDHRHFVTATWRRFQRVQLDAIRAHSDPRQFITTNVGGLGWSANWDHYRICEDLDLAAWDDYVGSGHLDVKRNALMNDFVRGWKRRNFWVMETQPGNVNWAPTNNPLNRGETRAMAWQDVAHGADAVLYWQWRSALNGQEQYHGCVVGPGGEPLPIYEELSRLGREFSAAAPALAGTAPNSEAALLFSYDSRWAIDFQLFAERYNQQQILEDWHAPLRALAGSVDVVQATAPLRGYKLVMAPSLNVIDSGLARHLLDYVRGGGHLLLGPRSGMKDQYDALNPQRQPGPLAGALGGFVEEYYALEDTVPVSGEAGAGSAAIWAERLAQRNPLSRVLLCYGTTIAGWLDGQPAMLRRDLGQGSIAYLGALLDPTLMFQVVAREAAAAGVTNAFPGPAVPDGVEISRRASASRTLWIAINFSKKPQTVEVARPMRNLLASGPASKRWRLARYAVAVLEAV